MSRYSKNKKKHWRKYCDVKTLEEELDNQRREQVVGCLATEKCNEDLFSIEKSTENDSHKKHKGLNGLISEYYVNCNSESEQKACDIVCDDSDDEIDIPKEALYAHVNTNLAKAVKCRGINSLRRQLINDSTFNIWDSDGQKSTKTKVDLKKLNYSYANELPDAGISYNPSFTDHQNLLNKATSEEKKRLYNVHQLNKKVKMPPILPDEREKQWLEELTEGIHPNWESEDDTTVNEELVKPVLVQTRRKTHKQRRKERLIKEAEKVRQAVKKEKIRMHDIYRIKKINKEITKQENAIKAKLMQKKANRDVNKIKRIGKYRYEKPHTTFQLSSMLSGSLRSVQADGNTLNDMYKYFQRKNMVEPKGPRTKARYLKSCRVKWVESRSHQINEDYNKNTHLFV